MTITNAQLASDLNDLLTKWSNREAEMLDWLNGDADGGPNSNGYYNITDVYGVVHLVACPKKLGDSVSGYVNLSANNAANAQTSEEEAASHAASALSRANQADSHRLAAIAAQGAAESAQSAAESAKTVAIAQANAAAASADSAAADAALVASRSITFSDTAQSGGTWVTVSSVQIDNNGNLHFITP